MQLEERDESCPVGSSVCDLFNELKGLDRESARSVWYVKRPLRVVMVEMRRDGLM